MSLPGRYEIMKGSTRSRAMSEENYLSEINWNQQGLVPAIAQDFSTGDVLMMAWMNAESLACTVREGRAVYWSRSRDALWLSLIHI